MQSFLDILLESTKEAEAPERYFWWAGLSALSAVVGKRVFIQRGAFYKLYPNIYVALVSARSGLRKGIPIAIVKNLLLELDKIRIISGCNSIQGLIKNLSEQKTFKSGAVVSEAQGILLSDEFESFLVDDPRALTYLTALHNTHEHENGWEKSLKSSPLEVLKAPCLSLLIASNEALFESMVKQKDIEGGFIARTFIVHESKRKRTNALVYSEEEIQQILKEDSAYKAEMLAKLRQLTMISGQMKFSPAAAKHYISWYDFISDQDVDDKTGTFDRLGDQVIKVSMLVALSERPGLTIEKQDLEKAITEVSTCLTGVTAVSMEKEKGEVNPVIEKILKALIRAPDQTLTRQKLLIATHIEALILDRAIETLIQRGAIENPKRNSKKEIFYKMDKATYETYVKFKTAERGVN